MLMFPLYALAVVVGAMLWRNDVKRVQKAAASQIAALTTEYRANMIAAHRLSVEATEYGQRATAAMDYVAAAALEARAARAACPAHVKTTPRMTDAGRALDGALREVEVGYLARRSAPSQPSSGIRVVDGATQPGESEVACG